MRYLAIISEQFGNDIKSRTLYDGDDLAAAFREATNCGERLEANGYEAVGRDMPGCNPSDPDAYPYATCFTCERIEGLVVCVYVRDQWK